MKKILLIILMLTAFAAQAQKFSIKGVAADSLTGPLPSATVMILNPKDSSLVNFGVTDVKGAFEIKNVQKGDYFLKITFIGYATYMKRLTTPAEGNEVDMGKIVMKPASQQLDELVVMGERNPVTVKKDTIEFNASSFKTKTNANVEDLLKTMPGIEVETDGTVRAQGEQVQRVLVDGREFFGRDPKLATRNLPADAVDKVQVFDRKSDNAQFTGIDDGQREKTINLELKEDKRNAAFGNLMAGYGTNDRFQATGSINKFSKGQQLSFLGMGNNINEQGFSVGDFMSFSGGAQSMMGGGGGTRIVTVGGSSGGSGGGPSLNFGGRQSGIMTNYAGGVNFNKDLNKDTKLTSSYFYNHLDRNISTATNRLNFYENTNLNNTLSQNSRSISNNENHRGTLMIDHNIDSANTLKVTANASYTESEQNALSQSQTIRQSDNSIANESQQQTYNEQTAVTLNASALWRHRFAKKGRNVSTNLSLGISSTDSDGRLNNTNSIYGDTPGEILQQQTNTQKTDNQSLGASVSFTEPLGGRKYLEANYNFSTNKNDVVREVYDVGGGIPEFNIPLSNQYVSNYIYNRPGLNFRMNREKYSVTAGASYQVTTLKGDVVSRDPARSAVINNTFQNMLPAVRFNYDFSSFKHLRLDYETSMQEPTVRQLQPFEDNSDILNIYIGNPELKPAYVHRVSANYTAFNPAKFINFFSFVNASYMKNAIVNSQFTDPTTFARTTRPVNVSSSKNLSLNFNGGFPVKKLNSRFNLGPTASFSESISVLNDRENNTSTQTVGGSVRYNFTYKEFVILDLSTNLSRQKTEYDFNTPDQQYFNQTYRGELNLSFLKKYAFNTAFDYLIYTSTTTDFRQAIPFWNMSVSRFILKNNAGEIKLGVNNILDQSNSVTQSSGENYLQQQTMNNLGRYFMLSFTYALNKHLNPMGGGRRGSGPRMIIRQ